MLAANNVTNALLALNSAANFAIYCLVGKKFRRILRRRIFRCTKTTAADDSSAPAPPESVAPAPAALGVPGSWGGSRTAVGTTETVRRSTDAAADCLNDSVRVNGNHVVVVVISATEAAGTACSSPTTPSADEELRAFPIDTDNADHELELHDDLDFDLELAAAVHDKDDGDGESRPDHHVVHTDTM